MRYLFQSLTALVTLLLIFSCSKAKHSVEEQIVDMHGRELTLPLQELERAESRVDSGHVQRHDKAFTLVVYMDTSECTTCQISRLYEWNGLMKAMDTVDFIFIVESDTVKMNELKFEVASCGLLNEVYLDTAFVFRNHNTFLPDDTRLHTFLLDKDGCIIVVGNPLYNQRLRELMMRVMNERSNEER